MRILAALWLAFSVARAFTPTFNAALQTFDVAYDFSKAVNIYVRPDPNTGLTGAFAAATSQQASRLNALTFASLFETYQLISSGGSTNPNFTVQNSATNWPDPAFPRSEYFGAQTDFATADPDVAAAIAASYLLNTFFWNQKEAASEPRLDGVVRTYWTARNFSSSSTAITTATSIGQTVAKVFTAAKLFDESAAFKPFINPSSPADGVYRFTSGQTYAFYPQLGDATPFVIEDLDKFPVAPPPNITTARYLKDLEEVKRLGQSTSTNRTEAQRQLVLFWRLGGGTSAIPGIWSQVAIALGKKLSYSSWRAAHLLAKLHTAIHDAHIAVWRAKYTYLSWRPETAIRNAAASTGYRDEAWSAYLATPAHPEYPSGHASACGAAAGLLTAYFGTDNITAIYGAPLSVYSEDVDGIQIPNTGVPGNIPNINYTSFRKIADDCSLSRILGGVHFRYATEAGQDLGYRIGEEIAKVYPGRLKKDLAAATNAYPSA